MLRLSVVVLALLVTSGETRTLLLDARTLRPVRTFPISGAAATSPTGDTAAFGEDEGSVTVLDLRTGTRRPMDRRATGRVLGLAFSPDGKVLATTSDDGSVSVCAAGKDAAPAMYRSQLLGARVDEVLKEAEPGLAAAGCDVADLL